jgi:outer membrane protein TolC
MRIWVLVPLVLIAATAQSAGAQTISMEDYLDRVQARHPFFVKESMQPDIETLGRDRYLGETDWDLGANAALRFVKPILLNSFESDRLTALNMGAAVGRAYWGNGARLSFSWEANYIDQKQPGIIIPSATGSIQIPVGPSRFYENRLVATYSYPLLQNKGGLLDKLGYEVSDHNIDFAEVQSLENQENFLFDIGTRFIDWALIQEERAIAEARLQFEEEQLEQTTRRRQANLVDEVDVLRGEDAVQIAREALVFTESRFKSQQAGLAVLAKDEGLYQLGPEMDLYALEVVPEPDAAVEKLRQQRLVQALRVRTNQLLTEERALLSVAKPELFLNLQAGLQEGNEDFADAWALTKPDVAVAVDFRYPLGNRTATADVQKTRLEMRQLEMEIESVSLDLEARLRALLIQINELEKVMVVNQEQIETARRKTEEELRRYNQGRGDLTFVIQSRDSEQRAHLTYAINAAAYHKLFLAYRSLVDELLTVE